MSTKVGSRWKGRSDWSYATTPYPTVDIGVPGSSRIMLLASLIDQAG
jgi:hypothetical protein